MIRSLKNSIYNSGVYAISQDIKLRSKKFGSFLALIRLTINQHEKEKLFLSRGKIPVFDRSLPCTKRDYAIECNISDKSTPSLIDMLVCKCKLETLTITIDRCFRTR